MKNISANYVLVDECFDLSSDHSPIMLTLSEKIIQKPYNPVLVNTKTNWVQFKVDINQYIDLSASLSMPASVDHELEKLVHDIQTAAWQNTPVVRKKLIGLNYPSEIVKTIKEKRKARQKWQTTRIPAYRTV